LFFLLIGLFNAVVGGFRRWKGIKLAVLCFLAIWG